MYRYLSIAAVVLSAAFSGPALAEGINSFSQAKAAAVKSTLTRPVRFIVDVKLTGRAKKALLICNRAAIRCAKMKTEPAA